MQKPPLADKWEPCLAGKTAGQTRLTRVLADAEAGLNDRVYHLFDLTPGEVQLLQKEVEH